MLVWASLMRFVNLLSRQGMRYLRAQDQAISQKWKEKVRLRDLGLESQLSFAYSSLCKDQNRQHG